MRDQRYAIIVDGKRNNYFFRTEGETVAVYYCIGFADGEANAISIAEEHSGLSPELPLEDVRG